MVLIRPVTVLIGSVMVVIGSVMVVIGSVMVPIWPVMVLIGSVMVVIGSVMVVIGSVTVLIGSVMVLIRPVTVHLARRGFQHCVVYCLLPPVVVYFAVLQPGLFRVYSLIHLTTTRTTCGIVFLLIVLLYLQELNTCYR